MVVSSRTPEGDRSRCPVCYIDLRLEPSQPFGDAPCPACGCLLWFVGTDEDRQWFERESAGEVRERLIRVLGDYSDLSPGQIRTRIDRGDPSLWEEIGRRTDSLEMIELVMEIENAADDARD